MTVPAEKRRVKQWYSELVSDLPDNCTLLDAVIVVKYLDAEGDVQIWCHNTEGLTPWEARGMADFAVEALRYEIADYESGE